MHAVPQDLTVPISRFYVSVGRTTAYDLRNSVLLTDSANPHLYVDQLIR